MMSLKAQHVKRSLVFLPIFWVFFSLQLLPKESRSLDFIETRQAPWETTLPPSVQQWPSLNPAVALSASTQRSRHTRDEIGVLGRVGLWLWDGGLSAPGGGCGTSLTAWLPDSPSAGHTHAERSHWCCSSSSPQEVSDYGEVQLCNSTPCCPKRSRATSCTYTHLGKQHLTSPGFVNTLCLQAPCAFMGRKQLFCT